MEIVLCSCGCIVKLMGVKRSYPTDPGVEQRGVIAFVMSFRKKVFNMVDSQGPPSPGSLRVPLTQKNLPAPSCLGTLHICELSVDPGRRLSRFLSFVLDGFLPSMPPGHPR